MHSHFCKSLTYNIECLEQNGRKCSRLDEKYFYKFSKRCKKIEFHEKNSLKYILSTKHAYAYYLIKLTLYVTE